MRGAVDLQHVPRARLLVQPVHVLRDEAPGGPVAALQARERLVRRIGLHIGELVPPSKTPRPAHVQSFSTIHIRTFHKHISLEKFGLAGRFSQTALLE